MRPARPTPFVLALLTALTLALLSPTAAHAARGQAPSKVSVLTFNVCGHAAGCTSWSKREDAVVSRIAEARADVVMVQETWGVLSRLEQRLTPRGYMLVADSGNEGVFAKTSKLTLETVATTETDCTYETVYLDPSIDTSAWDKRRPHYDEAGNAYYYSDKGWGRQVRVCTDSVVQVPKASGTRITGGGRAGAAWAMLRVKKTGKTYLFVSSHLSTGKNGVAGKRKKEAVTLLAVTASYAEGRPRIFGGDFNSSIQRGKDTVGARFKASGFTDSYTLSTSRRGAKYNTATGYGTKPAVGGSHIDRVFVPRGGKAAGWKALVKVRGGKAVKPIPSDHSPVRVSLVLP